MVGNEEAVDTSLGCLPNASWFFSCTESEVPDFLPCDDPGDAAAYWSALYGDAAKCSRRWRPYLPAANARSSGEFSIEEVSDSPFLDPTGTTAPPPPKRRG